jgi:hypothetical protein
MRKNYTKVEYFSKPILFITIYLLLGHKLIHNNNSMQGIIMRDFVQATEYDVHMYTKFGGLTSYELL